jgi:hypothetical protein
MGERGEKGVHPCPTAGGSERIREVAGERGERWRVEGADDGGERRRR